MHATGWTRQILQECRLSVHAELFHRAAEVGMKALVVAKSGSRTSTRKLGYNLCTVWADASEGRRLEVNRIFDLDPTCVRGWLQRSGEGIRNETYQGWQERRVRPAELPVYDPKPLPAPNIAHHLRKMAATLQLHYLNEVAGFAAMLHGVLTGNRNTIH